MSEETRTCQNCSSQFVIEPADFSFYEKLRVPAPTFCPDCRFQRRLMFCNERTLYKRDCGLCGRSMVTMYSPERPVSSGRAGAPESPLTVYCPECWWSDKWDQNVYARDYDPSRPFLEQFFELVRETPHIALSVDSPTIVNSPYVNAAGHLKNCYLIYMADFCENVLYSEMLAHDKDSMDCTMLHDSELCYGSIKCDRSYETHFSEDCSDCVNVYFSKRCIGCSNCFGCANLRGKRYHIWNEPYTKEEYEKRIKELRLDSYEAVERLKREALAFWQRFPRKFTHVLHNKNATGEYVYHSKNALDCYQVTDVEDSRFCQFVTLKPTRDVYDYTEWGNNVQRMYECLAVGENADTAKFSYYCWASVLDIEYSAWVVSSEHMFGCANVRKKRYCILNKEYSEEEYGALRARIVADMSARPYVSTIRTSNTEPRTIVYRYGEFFPPEFSPFAYNETCAMDYFPLAKEEVLARGYRWRDRSPSKYIPTMQAADLPDSIRDAPDGIIEEIIACGECGKPFRYVPMELELLRRFGFPLHRKCPECRYRERFSRVNPPRLWDRTCAKCGRGVRTSYSPERQEIIYCEQCYQAEVA